MEMLTNVEMREKITPHLQQLIEAGSVAIERQFSRVGVIETEEVLKLINEKPEHVEIILTGRNAPHQIIERADLVSEIIMRKHPWEKGINARRGIEY